MADSELADLTAVASVDGDELVYLVDDPAGTPLDRKVTVDDLLASRVAKALFDANTILAATADDTPAAVTVGEQTLVGRITAGAIAALTPEQVRTLLGLVVGTDVQAHSAVLDATTASFLVADETKLDGIEAGADVTDAVNVAAAGAVMDTGDETVAGVKTFSSPPIVPTPTADTEAANKAYVDGASSAVTIVTRADTHTLVIGDAYTQQKCTKATAMGIEVPASVFAAGDWLTIKQSGAGQVTVTAGAGLTLRAPDGAKSAKQYGEMQVFFDSATEATVGGNTTT